MSVTNTIETRFAADVTNYVSGVNKASKSLESFIERNKTLGQATQNAVKSIAAMSPAAFLAVTGLTALGTAAIASAKQAIALADDLAKVSARTGQTVESLSALKFAAEQSNSSFEDVQVGLRTLARTTAAAANGNKAAAKAFKDLGVEIRDANGNLKNSQQLFREVADGVASIRDPALKSAAAAAVLGRQAGPALVPLLNEGAAGLDALGKEASELGLIISAKFARESDEFGDNINKLQGLSIGFGQAIASEVLPAVNQLLVELINLGKAGLKPTIAFLQETSFVATKAAAALALVKVSGKLAGAQLRGNKDAATDARKQFDDLNATLTRTKEEWLALREASPADEIKQTGGDALTSTQQLSQLVDEFTALDKAVDPVVNLAKSLAGVFPELNPRFANLVEQLKGVASSGPEAAKALKDVLAVAAQARSDISDELGQSFRDLTGGGGEVGSRIGRPLSRQGEQREAGVQGPLTQEQAAGGGEPLGATQEALGETPTLLEDAVGFGEQLGAALLEDAINAEALNTTLAKGQGILAGLTQFAFGLGDAIADVFEGNKTAIAEFFSSLLKQLGRAIIRATILATILSIISGGGFSIAAIIKSAASQLGFGSLGFQDKESSIMGRASQARGMPGGFAGPALAAAPAAGANSSLVVQIHEPGPLTWSEITDRKVLPRLRERQRRLNEQPL